VQHDHHSFVVGARHSAAKRVGGYDVGVTMNYQRFSISATLIGRYIHDEKGANMALLETMTAEEAIKHGVTVYPHVTEPKAQHSDFMQAHIAAEVAAIDAQPQTWCEKCNLPDDICRGHDDAIPADVAAALTAQHSAEWRERLIDELLALLPSTLARQIAQLDGDGITALARQLARADSTKASLIAEALWSEAMDVEHARLCADDTVMEGSNQRAVLCVPVTDGDGAPLPGVWCGDELIVVADEWDTIAGMAGA